MRKLISSLLPAALAALTVAPLAQAQAPAAPLARRPNPAVQPSMPPKGGERLTVAPTGGFMTLPAVPKARPGFRAPRRAPESFPVIHGCVQSASHWTSGYSPRGMYQIATGDDTYFNLLAPDVTAQGGGAVVGDYFWAVTYLTYGSGQVMGTIDQYDIEDGWKHVGSSAISDWSAIAYDTAIDPTTETVYGCFFDAAGQDMVWGTIDYESGLRTELAPLDRAYVGVAIDAEGRAYGVDTSGRFGAIDKATGAFTEMSDLGHVPGYLSSAAMDLATGRFFVNIDDADKNGWLIEVDTATGEAVYEYHYPYNQEIQAMYVPRPAAQDKAPAAPTDLSADFPQGSLSGAVRFRAPALLFDGTEPQDPQMTYSVVCGSEQVASGDCLAGNMVSANLSVDQPGEYEFTVTLSNAAGRSPRAKVGAYIGADSPLAPASARAAYDEAAQTFTVDWDAVTRGVNGGWIDADAVTYEVRFFPGDVAVAQAHRGTSLTYAHPLPQGSEACHFEVRALAGASQSAWARTNTVVLGHFSAPYLQDFSQEDALAGFTVLDVNNDEKTWYLDAANHRAGIDYNKYQNMNDWLISPPIAVEAGKAYLVSLDAWSRHKDYEEKLEVWAGYGNDPAALDQEVVPVTVVTTPTTDAADAKHLSGYVTAQRDGLLYVGIRGCSPKDLYTLYVSNLSVEAGMVSTVPAAPAIEVIPDGGGELKADVTVTAPEVDFAGKAVSGPIAVTLSRDGQEIGTRSGLNPGQAATFSDQVYTGGNHVYTATASNASGTGPEASVTSWIGFGIPEATTEVVIVENPDNLGEITVSWQPIWGTVDGQPILPDLVTFRVETSKGQVLEDVHGSSVTFRACEATDPCDFVVATVTPSTTGGAGAPTSSLITAIGQPNALPYAESVPDAQMSHGIASAAGGAQWGIINDQTLPGVTSADGDNGYFCSRSTMPYGTAVLYLGKMDLRPCAHPALSLQILNPDDPAFPDGSPNEVVVTIIADDLTAQTYGIAIADLPVKGWNRTILPLTDFIGKVVQVSVTSQHNVYTYTHVDDIRLYDSPDCNIGVEHVSAPAAVRPNKDFTISATVVNNGSNPAEHFTVELLRDGEVVEEQDGWALSQAYDMQFEFIQELAVTDPESVSYQVRVTLEGDQDAADDLSEPVAVALRQYSYPAVDDLSGQATDQGNTLAWSVPDVDTFGDPTLADFEDGEPFADTYADWTLVDADQSPVGSFQMADIPGVTAGVTPKGFIVFDAAQLPSSNSLLGRSGNKWLGSLYRWDGGRTDDWAISPLLDGSAQTVTFWAKSYDAQYPESIEMLYSLGGTDLESFVKVKAVDALPGSWTQYSFDIPEGARHFAIRSCATNAFICMIDDVEFVRSRSASELTLKGFNLYRDNVLYKANLSPSATGFVDQPDGRTHSYMVTVEYRQGESRPSNVVTLTPSGIGQVNADQGESRTYDLLGRPVSEPSQPGVYIRVRDGKATKSLRR